MIAHLHLTNDLIAGMIELDIFMPVERKFYKSGTALVFTPTVDRFPPWRGWWKNSGNQVFGDAAWGSGELICEFITVRSHSIIPVYMNIGKRKIFRPNQKLVLQELMPPEHRWKAPEDVPKLEKHKLRISQLSVL